MNRRKISWIAILVALSAVGASIKIPAVVGSVALDVFPALLAAALLGSGTGALVAAAGHLLSAFLGGMPVGFFHLLIASEMACLVWAFGYFYKKGRNLQGSILFVLGNALVAPLPFYLLMGKAFYLSIVPSLFVGSLLNVVVAWVVVPRLSSFYRSQFTKGDLKL
jgi:uncharacterized membrane protein